MHEVTSFLVHVFVSWKTLPSEAAHVQERRKIFCGSNQMFPDLVLRWHETFEVCELSSESLIINIFPEESDRFNLPLKGPWYPKPCSSSHLTSSHKLPQSAKNTGGSCSPGSSPWGLLTKPDSDPSNKPFDHFNAHCHHWLGLVGVLPSLPSWKKLKSLFVEGAVWSPCSDMKRRNLDSTWRAGLVRSFRGFASNVEQKWFHTFCFVFVVFVCLTVWDSQLCSSTDKWVNKLVFFLPYIL